MKEWTFIIIMLCFVGTASLQAQINYNEEPDVSTLLNRYISQNKGKMGIKGWRVQILSTTDRRKMENTKAAFLSKFPGHQPVWSYNAPHYKLQVGAFRSKLETEKLKHILREEYPSAFPVKDDTIKPVEFL